MSSGTTSECWHPHFELGVQDVSQRRKPRESLGSPWEGAKLVSGRPVRRSTSEEQVARQKKGLAVHFARREYPVRGPVVPIGSYIQAYLKKKIFLQLPAALLAMPNPKHAIYLGLLLFACGHNGAAVIDAERAEIARLLEVGRDCVSRFNRFLVQEGLLTREYDYWDLASVGRKGRRLRHPQKGNLYSMGPALREIWAEHQRMVGPQHGESYPQAALPAEAENVVKNSSCKPGPDPLIKPKTIDPDFRSKESPSTVTVVGESARTPTTKAANSKRAHSVPNAFTAGVDSQPNIVLSLMALLDDVSPDDDPDLAAMLARRVLAKSREYWNAPMVPRTVGQRCSDGAATLSDDHLHELASSRADFSARAQERRALSDRRRDPDRRH